MRPAASRLTEPADAAFGAPGPASVITPARPTRTRSRSSSPIVPISASATSTTATSSGTRARTPPPPRWASTPQRRGQQLPRDRCSTAPLSTAAPMREHESSPSRAAAARRSSSYRSTRPSRNRRSRCSASEPLRRSSRRRKALFGSFGALSLRVGRWPDRPFASVDRCEVNDRTARPRQRRSPRRTAPCRRPSVRRGRGCRSRSREREIELAGELKVFDDRLVEALAGDQQRDAGRIGRQQHAGDAPSSSSIGTRSISRWAMQA